MANGETAGFGGGRELDAGKFMTYEQLADAIDTFLDSAAAKDTKRYFNKASDQAAKQREGRVPRTEPGTVLYPGLPELDINECSDTRAEYAGLEGQEELQIVSPPKDYQPIDPNLLSLGISEGPILSNVPNPSLAPYLEPDSGVDSTPGQTESSELSGDV